MMLDTNPTKRMKADFFIELYAVVTDREVMKMDWFKRDAFTNQMLRKYHAKGIRSVTEFRKVKQLIANAVKTGHRKQINSRLKAYAETPKLDYTHLEIAKAAAEASAKKLIKSIGGLHGSLADLDVEQFYGREDLWAELEKLRETISALLLKAGKRIK